jgi:hypothetical protein
MGKDDHHPDNQHVSDYVVRHLIQLYLNKGINITTGNYFTSLKLSKKFKENVQVSLEKI